MVHNFIKKAMPPLFIQAYKGLVAKPKGHGLYTGPYRSWEQALKHAGGYDSEIIINHVSNAISLAKTTKVGFERDGVLIENQDYAYPMLAYLARHAARYGNLNVIDFGGGLGSSFFQAKQFFGDSLSLNWQVVEQPQFVRSGEQLQLDTHLSFRESLEQCERRENDLLLISGVLQYLDSPFELLRDCVELGFREMLIDRVPLTPKAHHQIMVQHVPKQLYEASYPSWLFSSQKWFDELSRVGRVADTFAAIDGDIHTLKHEISFQGAYLCRK